MGMMVKGAGSSTAASTSMALPVASTSITSGNHHVGAPRRGVVWSGGGSGPSLEEHGSVLGQIPGYTASRPA